MKIIFCLLDLYLGGTEKALLSLLSAMDLMKNDISIGLVDDKGPLLTKVPKQVKILKLPLSDKQKSSLTSGGALNSIKKNLKDFKILKVLKISLKKLLRNNLAELDGNFNKIKGLNDIYDVAVSFQFHNTFITRYVAEKINAKRKCVWVHNDFSSTNFNIDYVKKYINNYNDIFVVSKQIYNETCSLLPFIKDKVKIFLNVLNKDDIIKKSEEKIAFNYDGNFINILSVGRLTAQKGFDLAVEAAKKLDGKGIKFKWYIIGNGELKEELELSIKKNKLENKVILLGALDNPYPYMKYCDIYVQTSRHEGYCTTTNECKLFNKPIITTNVSGADEQFINEYNGIIVNFDLEEIYLAITKIINDINFRNKLTVNLKNSNIVNSNKALIEWNNSLS